MEVERKEENGATRFDTYSEGAYILVFIVVLFVLHTLLEVLLFGLFDKF
ncbi:hypothetical protein GGE08_002234 [Muricauda sp. ARW1Y1]|jgi:hypothetical protein|nr:hypothetical protein [Muricauda sp. ARW1Y1]